MESKEKLIEKLFEKGILVNKDMIDKDLKEDLLDLIKAEEDLIVLNDDYAKVIAGSSFLVDWYEIDKYRVGFEKKNDQELYQTQLQDLKSTTISVSNKDNTTSDEDVINSLESQLDEKEVKSSFESKMQVSEKITTSIEAEGDLAVLEKINQELQYEVIYSYETISQKYTVKDFWKVFLSRYQYLEKIICQHPEIKNVMSINRLAQKKEREKITVIGLIEDIAETRNGNLIATIEDSTGSVKVLFSKNKEDLLKKGKELVFDEVVGIVGNNGNGIIFADDIIWPDIPSTKEFKKAEQEEYAIFLSDIHIGSTYFLDEAFGKFIKWINGEIGNDSQREIVSKIKYIFIAGDVVDGVGIYPAQESELTITKIEDQYAEFAKLIKQIPADKQIFICPGNHDLVHLAEPQPVIYEDYAKELHEMPNVELVSNPSMINIGKTKSFSGFDVLMYHGYSFDFYVAHVDHIRNGGGYHRADLIMKFLLKRRHLAPAFKSTPILPAHSEDPLLIKKVPDIMISGHIHYSSIANYKGITMICGSCWQAQTKFQEKLGHDPEPGRVPIVNLKTREVRVLKFI